MQRLDLVAAPAQLLGQFVDLGSRAREHQRQRGRLQVQHASECGDLVRALHDVGGLAHAWQSPFLGLLTRDQHAHRIAQVLVGDRRDARWQRGRKERRLPLRGRGIEDQLDVLGEAHIEHLVGFVQHDGGQRAQVQRATADVIERAARRGHHHMHAALQRLCLPAELRAAVDRQHDRAQLRAVAVQRFRDLDCEFACRYQHQRGWVGGLAVCGKHTLQQRQCERPGLAGAGGGLAEQIAPLEQRRDGLALDRSRLLVTEAGEDLREFLCEAEIDEGTFHWRSVAAGTRCAGERSVSSKLRVAAVRSSAETVRPQRRRRMTFISKMSAAGC